MKKIFFCFVVVLLWGNRNCYCQNFDNKKLEQTITAAYAKAYPACVKLFAYDTVARQQAGGQFSGVVVKDGYILTAAHVATPGVVYKVMYGDGKQCLAVGLGKIEFAEDKTRPDVAMLKIITQGSWPYAQMANSSALKVFEPCISLSYPESLYQDKPILRFGYISDILNERGFIKSTCIMEPGDSGGPLFDYLGRLIGIHSAIEIPEADNYDVPVNLYTKYWTALKMPKVYTALPDMTDKVPADSLSGAIVTLPGLKNNIAFAAAGSAFKGSCVTVVSNLQAKEQQVAGTLFAVQKIKAGKSIIISKSSLVGDKPVIIYADHRRINAKVIARDKENDLVLIEPDGAIKGGIDYTQLSNKKSNVIQPGKFMVSVLADTLNSISISGSSAFSIPKITNGPFLGTGFKNRSAPLLISYIFPNLNKSIYQLKIGDEVIKVNNDTTAGLNDLFKKVSNYWPGDSIKLTLKRAGNELTETIMLDTVPQRHFNHPAEMFNGGKSGRRDGFNKVFTHDAVIKPEKCGGPVFDTDGDFYGINIARYSRTSCLAIPAEVIYSFINNALLNDK